MNKASATERKLISRGRHSAYERPCSPRHPTHGTTYTNTSHSATSHQNHEKPARSNPVKWFVRLAGSFPAAPHPPPKGRDT